MKKIIFISSIYDLDNALQEHTLNEGGLRILPDFELIYIENQRYLLIIKG